MWGAGSSGGPRGPTTAGEVLCASGFGCNPGLGVPRERTLHLAGAPRSSHCHLLSFCHTRGSGLCVPPHQLVTHFAERKAPHPESGAGRPQNRMPVLARLLRKVRPAHGAALPSQASLPQGCGGAAEGGDPGEAPPSRRSLSTGPGGSVAGNSSAEAGRPYPEMPVTASLW